MNAISILRSDKIRIKLKSESARELSGYVSDGMDIYWNNVPGKFTHRDAAKKEELISLHVLNAFYHNLVVAEMSTMTLWILWSHLHSDQNYVINRYSTDNKTRQIIELDDIFLVLLTLGQQWQLGLASNHLWAVCSPMHVHGRMSMAVWLLKSSKYMLSKYLGVFETEPVDADILTVNVQQLLYYTSWPHGASTT